MAALKKYTNKIALTDNFTKRAKCEEGNQYQQAYNTGRNQLVERAATKFGKRLCEGPIVYLTYNNLFNGV